MVTTHLVLFSFFDGASGSAAPPVVPVAPSPGGSGKHYRTHTDWDSQRERNRRKLEARVGKLEKRIDQQKKKLDLSRETVSQKRLEELSQQLRKLQALLLELLAELDAMNKENEEAEMSEVMAIYLAYRSLH